MEADRGREIVCRLGFSFKGECGNFSLHPPLSLPSPQYRTLYGQFADHSDSLSILMFSSPLSPTPLSPSLSLSLFFLFIFISFFLFSLKNESSHLTSQKKHFPREKKGGEKIFTKRFRLQALKSFGTRNAQTHLFL